MDLSTLVKMSNTYGSNPAYVLAGGEILLSRMTQHFMLRAQAHSLPQSRQKNLLR